MFRKESQEPQTKLSSETQTGRRKRYRQWTLLLRNEIEKLVDGPMQAYVI